MLQQLRRIIVPESTKPVYRPTAWYVQVGESSFAQSGGQPEYRDSDIKVVGALPVAVGPLRFVGDVWLSNCRYLQKTYEIDAGATDLEVLSQLWSAWGDKCLPLLQGAFCFVAWDTDSRKMEIVRDAVGARSIYIGTRGEARWISPRLHAAARYCDRTINPVALRDYLCAAFVPGEQTLFQNVREVRPGTIHNLVSARTYWTIKEDYEALESEPLEWHAAQLRTLLEDVISEQLPQGEDVGCYLSGGLDSSSVVALASKLHDKPVHCFSIHFGSECPNELEFSSMVAEHCRVQHQVIEITPDDMWKMHREVIGLLDDPIGDPLTVPNLILGRIARERTNVILNGEGGDPCFGGPKNQPMMLDSLYQPEQSAKENAQTSVNAYLASFQKCASDLTRLLTPEIYRATQAVPSVFEADLLSPGHYVNKLLLINTKFKGADHILTKVHNITSAVGLQGRSPLFDRRIVEASLSIPPQHKLKGAQEKAVLKAAVQDLLPERILNRPKSGMMVPVQLWYRKKWNSMARQLLLSRKAKVAAYLDQTVIKDWLDYRGDTWGRYGVKLWLLCALELWMQVHDAE